ncbi:hypothetical protein BJX68DRAFT_164548 [Aspergillus pseudodeflectus]|uniref:Secreted protein n=1 Tax=Aspergillus pseudodeflectus TaxID=176178 RepID=A0ABR4L1C0_9EURO
MCAFSSSLLLYCLRRIIYGFSIYQVYGAASIVYYTSLCGDCGNQTIAVKGSVPLRSSVVLRGRWIRLTRIRGALHCSSWQSCIVRSFNK